MTRIWVERKEEIIKTGISPIFPPLNPFTSHTETNIMLGAIQFKTESDKRMYFPDQWLIPQGFSERRNAKFLKYEMFFKYLFCHELFCVLTKLLHFVSWVRCGKQRYTFHFPNLWLRIKISVLELNIVFSRQRKWTFIGCYCCFPSH